MKLSWVILCCFKLVGVAPQASFDGPLIPMVAGKIIPNDTTTWRWRNINHVKVGDASGAGDGDIEVESDDSAIRMTPLVRAGLR